MHSRLVAVDNKAVASWKFWKHWSVENHRNSQWVSVCWSNVVEGRANQSAHIAKSARLTGRGVYRPEWAQQELAASRALSKPALRQVSNLPEERDTAVGLPRTLESICQLHQVAWWEIGPHQSPNKSLRRDCEKDPGDKLGSVVQWSTPDKVCSSLD